jgi:hypothetical protein
MLDQTTQKTMSHKGSWHRLGDAPAYRNNYDEIFKKKKENETINTDTDDTRKAHEVHVCPGGQDCKADRQPSRRAPDPE